MLKTLDVVAAIIEKDNKILLAQRPMHADQPGMWEFAGGKVEAGAGDPRATVALRGKPPAGSVAAAYQFARLARAPLQR